MRITISVPDDFCEEVKSLVGDDKPFKDVSHLFTRCAKMTIARLRAGNADGMCEGVVAK